MDLYHYSGTKAILYGAVKMPNGPFVILGGQYGGHQIQPGNANEGAVAQTDGPLYLYVGANGVVKAGSPNNGYVFGFRGYLKY